MSGAIYRHKKRGTFYEVLGVGVLQIEGPNDETPVVIYQGEKGDMWVRPFAEFHDGRFEIVEGPVA